MVELLMLNAFIMKGNWHLSTYMRLIYDNVLFFSLNFYIAEINFLIMN